MYKVVVCTPAERANMLPPYSILPLYVLCGQHCNFQQPHVIKNRISTNLKTSLQTQYLKTRSVELGATGWNECAAKSLYTSIFKKRRHFGFGVFIVIWSVVVWIVVYIIWDLQGPL